MFDFSQTYHDSMAKLQLLTEDELNQIFGQISTLVPLHEGMEKTLGINVTLVAKLEPLYWYPVILVITTHLKIRGLYQYTEAMLPV